MARRQQNPGPQRETQGHLEWMGAQHFYRAAPPRAASRARQTQQQPKHITARWGATVAQKTETFLCSSAAFSSAQTKNLAQRCLYMVCTMCGTNTATQDSVKSLTLIRLGFYTMFYWCCYASNWFCIIYSHMCKKLTWYSIPNFVILLLT